MIRLLVADAQYIVRMGLKQLCLEWGGATVAGEATNGDEVLEALSKASFDMMVLDPALSGGGAGFIENIRTRYANLPMLAFTMHSDPQLAKRVLDTGVSGIVSKDSGHQTLVEALRKVAAGEYFISSDIAIKMMFESTVDKERVLREQITARELQVMTLFAQGKTVNAIAAELEINSRTVSTHKMRLMRKMNFKSNVELVHYTVECGLVELRG